MKKYTFLLSLSLFLATIISCKKEPDTPIVKNDPKAVLPTSMQLKAVETDSGVVLTWDRIGVSTFKSYELVRTKTATGGGIFSPWSGDYIWAVGDSILTTVLDKAPAFSDKTYYKVSVTTTTGERLTSNTVELEFKNSVFVKNYKSNGICFDSTSNTIFMNDAFTSKIRSVNYITKAISAETTVETPVGSGGEMLIVPNGANKDLYVSSKSYGLLNIFDSKTLQLKKKLDVTTTVNGLIHRNGLVYAASTTGIAVIRASDYSIIQTFPISNVTSKNALLFVPNTNKILVINDDFPNIVNQLTLNGDGTIQSAVKLTAPSSVANDVWGFNTAINPVSGNFIAGFNGNIYNASFGYVSTLNLNLPNGLLPVYSYSPNGQYLAVSLSNVRTAINIYDATTLVKKTSFEMPDCTVQKFSWIGNTLITTGVASGDYLFGTVSLLKKIAN
jgi:hypothetical protein